ncbi:MAG TPA: ammonia-forming cytochrome c nitrite reductase subunit c552 [Kofleriaceae bacterium]|nr:ammonia-forming cytochrome c nitrite reductase subunit c552 [Kofleriaceae bacterium]
MQRRLVALVVVAACTRDTPSPSPSSIPIPSPNTSNIARADYIGPDACGNCHPDQYAAWSQSLHRVMNARADEPGAVIGDFDNAVLHYAGGEARFTREGGNHVMTTGRVRYRVTRTIGRRGLQEYVGVADGRTEEVRLPFGWWPRAGGWFPQPYFDPWLGDERGFDAYAEVTEPWAERCPWCHSTYPFAQRIARASGPRGVGHGLEQLFEASPGGARLAIDEQVTVGISCESCHLGGREHAAGGAIAFVPRGAEPRAGAPTLPAAFADQRRDADVVDAVCAQCHSGPSPRLADGTALRNSSEALDLAASPCRGIKCTDCHDPHAANSRADGARALAACTRCHAALADPAAARSHAGTGHDAVTCMDCHMPRVVMGLDRYVRTHRISSPTDARVIADVNACNLCHLDRSLAWTRAALRDGWDVNVAVPDDDRAAGERWLASERPAIRLLAAHAYARSPLGPRMLPAIERGLADPLAYVRAWTKLAVEAVLGHPLARVVTR